MTLRTFVDKNGNSWEWTETPETVKAIQELAKFSGDYSGSFQVSNVDLNNENKIES